MQQKDEVIQVSSTYVNGKKASEVARVIKPSPTFTPYWWWPVATIFIGMLIAVR